VCAAWGLGRETGQRLWQICHHPVSLRSGHLVCRTEHQMILSHLLLGQTVCRSKQRVCQRSFLVHPLILCSAACSSNDWLDWGGALGDTLTSFLWQGRGRIVQYGVLACRHGCTHAVALVMLILRHACAHAAALTMPVYRHVVCMLMQLAWLCWFTGMYARMRIGLHWSCWCTSMLHAFACS
jgi:hypothetical protein